MPETLKIKRQAGTSPPLSVRRTFVMLTECFAFVKDGPMMTTTSINGFQSMKTMLDLLIRLQEMRCCCERARHNPQLTDREKAVACHHKTLVRECLPAEVLERYDRMKESDPELLECPEVFAMAVLVSTYLGSSPRKRRSLLKHFATPLTASGKKAHQNGKPRIGRNGMRRCKTVRADFVGRP